MDFKNISVRLRPNGEIVSEVVFDALKRVMGGIDDPLYGQFSQITAHMYLSVSELSNKYMIDRMRVYSEVKTPTEILGEPLMKAIADGYTPWFEGDEIPEGEALVMFGDGSGSSRGGRGLLLAFSKDIRGDILPIAYKKSKPRHRISTSTQSDFETRVLVEKLQDDINIWNAQFEDDQKEMSELKETIVKLNQMRSAKNDEIMHLKSVIQGMKDYLDGKI